jgi:hypothetical protein
LDDPSSSESTSQTSFLHINAIVDYTMKVLRRQEKNPDFCAKKRTSRQSLSAGGADVGLFLR